MFNPEVADAMATHAGLVLARDMGYQHVILESNWLHVQAFNHRANVHADAGFIIEDRALLLWQYNAISATSFSYKMAGFGGLAPKTKNLVVAGGLSAFVFGVYFYTMRAVGGTDELQTAIDKFEQQKSKQESEATIPSKA
ncbi:unnamed protein product [Dovyalis caffra]|uniref:Cytochrome c oxidase assembly factor 3 mitochondrial coiled-coil domain-containing protein n=1 Tax=Dovyalis caffra TaxID=77055 RepID=A0AAV1QNI2_9ROSI|nr:unnamed protein product [Dovyalis caffra]